MNNNYLNNLYKSCQNLATISQINKNQTFSLISTVINSFNNLKKNTDDEELIYNAIAIIIDVKETRPQLRGVVDAILDIIKESFQEEIKTRR